MTYAHYLLKRRHLAQAVYRARMNMVRRLHG